MTIFSIKQILNYKTQVMTKQNALFSWLILSAFMVVVMVFVGGWTRLADAGLSITEWKPLSGVFPPITDAAWEEEFAKYQSFPEFQKIHNHFTISEFKQIFWLEFIHRIFGRITGLIILVPGLIFYMRGYFKGELASYLSIMFLVAFQGFIGWWMVKSGLIDNPHVSHFRLAVHLITALILYSLILWKIFDIKEIKKLDFYNYKAYILAFMGCFLLFIQITLGAFVAGLDAGMIYNTFPMMGSRFIPSEFYLGDIWYDSASIQFLHRGFAYVVSIFFLILGFMILKHSKPLAIILISSLAIQFLLGVLTLIYVVPLKLALAHQLFAVLLLSITIYVLYRTRR